MCAGCFAGEDTLTQKGPSGECGMVSSCAHGTLGKRTMGILDFLLLLLVAGVIGAVGQAIAGYSLGGCLVSIAVGFVGAAVGLWIGRNLGIPELLILKFGSTRFPIVWSLIGAVLFVIIVGLVTGKAWRVR